MVGDKACCLRMHTLLVVGRPVHHHYYVSITITYSTLHNDRKHLTVFYTVITLVSMDDVEIKYLSFDIDCFFFSNKARFIKGQMNAKFLLFDIKNKPLAITLLKNQFRHIAKCPISLSFLSCNITKYTTHDRNPQERKCPIS